MNFDERVSKLLEKEDYNVYDLAEIVSLLRSEKGCPWDKVQTHESIRRDFLEETYEVLEAIDCGSAEMMREELGDVLLQVIFHTDIEKDKGAFDLDAVADEVCKKLILRHPFSATFRLTPLTKYLPTGTPSRRTKKSRKRTPIRSKAYRRCSPR